MIGRLMRAGTALFACFCVATILAQIIVVTYLTLRWQVDRNKMVQILAIAQGVDILAIKEQAELDRDEVSAEQVSHEQIMQTRAVKVRHLELREQALRQELAHVASEQRNLADEMNRHAQLRDSFQKELLDLREGAVATGRENARLKLESLKPQQAKEQLVEMLKNDEMNEVVALLAAMPDTKASKIMAQFTTPEESEQLYQILRRIRKGSPESDLAVDIQNQLSEPKPIGP